MENIYDFTFCAIDLDISEKEISAMYNEVKMINESHWYHDKFRGCYILPLYNGGGTTGAPKEGVIRSKGNMIFTEAGKKCPTIEEIVLNRVFPFMDINGRMSVLKTKPGDHMNVHMDSNEQSVGTRQHKFRIVLNGEINKLYFLDKSLNKVYVPDHYNTYILDGTHPHSIETGEEKITICIGTPWRGHDNPIYENLVNSALFKMKVSQPKFQKQWECK